MFGIKIGKNEVKKSITGKDLKLNDKRDILYLRDLDVEEYYAGKPIVSIFKNDEKTYNTVSIRLISPDESEELRLSVNYPKKDCPLVKNLNEDFGFYLNAFNLVKDIAILNEVEGVDKDIRFFTEVNFKEIVEFIDGLDELEIQAFYPVDNQYMSFRVVKYF